MKRDRLLVWTVVLLICLVALSGRAGVQAEPITQGDILVTQGGGLTSFVKEFTPTGTLVQTITLPMPGDEGARGVVVDSNGNVQIYNGTFRPFLTTYIPNTNTFVNTSIPGLNTVNDSTFGGIAAFGNSVFLTSTFTGVNPVGGLIRVNINDLSSKMFASGIDFTKVAAGRDGLLYGLEGSGSPGGNKIGVYNPNSFAFIRNITLPVELRGIAVDASGDIFGIGFRGTFYELTPEGTVVKTLATPGGSDIALSPTGAIVGSVDFGNVFLTDTSLSGLTANFNPGGAELNFVAFVEPPLGAASVSEPTTLALIGLGTLGVLGYGWLRLTGDVRW